MTECWALDRLDPFALLAWQQFEFLQLIIQWLTPISPLTALLTLFPSTSTVPLPQRSVQVIQHSIRQLLCHCVCFQELS